MRRMNKKGADISITVIIVAAIALIVFVVLVAIFTGRIGLFSKGLNSAGDATKPCESISNQYKRDKCNAGEVQVASSDAVAEGKVCCFIQPLNPPT